MMFIIDWIVGAYAFGLSEIKKLLELAASHLRLLMLVVIVSLGCSYVAYGFNSSEMKEEQETKNQEISQKIDKLGDKLEYKIDELKNILILRGNR